MKCEDLTPDLCNPFIEQTPIRAPGINKWQAAWDNLRRIGIRGFGLLSSGPRCS